MTLLLFLFPFKKLLLHLLLYSGKAQDQFKKNIDFLLKNLASISTSPRLIAIGVGTFVE